MTWEVVYFDGILLKKTRIIMSLDDLRDSLRSRGIMPDTVLSINKIAQEI